MDYLYNISMFISFWSFQNRAISVCFGAEWANTDASVLTALPAKPCCFCFGGFCAVRTMEDGPNGETMRWCNGKDLHGEATGSDQKKLVCGPLRFAAALREVWRSIAVFKKYYF